MKTTEWIAGQYAQIDIEGEKTPSFNGARSLKPFMLYEGRNDDRPVAGLVLQGTHKDVFMLIELSRFDISILRGHLNDIERHIDLTSTKRRKKKELKSKPRQLELPTAEEPTPLDRFVMTLRSILPAGGTPDRDDLLIAWARIAEGAGSQAFMKQHPGKSMKELVPLVLQAFHQKKPTKQEKKVREPREKKEKSAVAHLTEILRLHVDVVAEQVIVEKLTEQEMEKTYLYLRLCDFIDGHRLGDSPKALVIARLQESRHSFTISPRTPPIPPPPPLPEGWSGALPGPQEPLPEG